MTYRRDTHPAMSGAASVRPVPRTSVRAREVSELEEKPLHDFKIPPPHFVKRTPVVALDHVPDEAPRLTALPTRRACLMVTHQDAALLVVAVGVTLRLGAGANTTLSAEEVTLVRRVAALLHRILPPAARDAIRQHAARMSPDSQVRAVGIASSGAR